MNGLVACGGRVARSEEVELELLKHLVEARGGSFASHVRRAIRYYAHDAFADNTSELGGRIHSSIEDRFADEQERNAVIADLRGFLDR